MCRLLLIFLYFRETCKREEGERRPRCLSESMEGCKAPFPLLRPEQCGVSYTTAGPRRFRANTRPKSLQNHTSGWRRSCRPWAGVSAGPGLWRCWVCVCARSLQDGANSRRRSGRSRVVACGRSVQFWPGWRWVLITLVDFISTIFLCAMFCCPSLLVILIHC